MSCLSIANFLLLKFAYLDFVVHDMSLRIAVVPRNRACSSYTLKYQNSRRQRNFSLGMAVAMVLVYKPYLLTRTVFNLCNRLITKAINVCQEKMSMDSHSSQSSIARSSASYIKRVQVLSISVLMHRSVLLLKHHTSALRLL